MATIAIFFSSGAFGDCARHAILHALEDDRVAKINVYASERNLPSLDEANWKCGCKTDHGSEMKKSPNFDDKVQLITVDVTDAAEMSSSGKKVDLNGVDAVISGLGNRQMFIGDRVARKGTKNIVAAMRDANVQRIVAMSSMGVNDDKPCMEWRSEGKFMAALFKTVSRREYKDIAGMEKDLIATDASDINYLLVRPVGLGEECVPRDEFFIQKKKFDDVLGPNMAKMDVGKFLVEEALDPTFERRAVVIGADPAEANVSFAVAGMERKEDKEGDAKSGEK